MLGRRRRLLSSGREEWCVVDAALWRAMSIPRISLNGDILCMRYVKGGRWILFFLLTGI
jgi:hypothetical protein